MANTHLRPQAGGDPARSVSDDLKNPTAAPAAGNDFPDAPADSDGGSSQDKPDLDAFAKRMGTDTIESGEGLGAVPNDRSEASPGTESSSGTESSWKSDPRVIIGGLGTTVAAAIVLVVRRRRQRGILAKAAALGAAAHVVRN